MIVSAGRTTQELMQIAAAGGGFEMLAPGRTTQELMQIAAAAKSGNATIYMINLAGRTTQELMQIGAASKGHVVFVASRTE